MAGYCINFLFYSYASATVIYLILGLFASSGNIPLLMDNYRYNSSNQELEEGEPSNVKNRTLGQYFLASGLTLGISIALYYFYFRDKKENEAQIINQNLNIINDDNLIIQEKKEEIVLPLKDDIINKPIINNNNNIIDDEKENIINTDSVPEGMSEKNI